MATWREQLTLDERRVLVALLGAGAALNLDEVAARANAGTVHDELTALHAHGLVAHSTHGWGLTPRGRTIAADLA